MCNAESAKHSSKLCDRDYSGEVYVFGAHSRAQTLGVYLTELFSGLTISAYLVDNEEKNPDKIENVPVIHITENTKLNRTFPVYVGTRGVYHEAIGKRLAHMGMKQVIPMTPELDIELRNRFVAKVFAKTGRTFIKFGELAETKTQMRLYVVQSAADVPLVEEPPLNAHERKIQAGRALTDADIAEGILRDDIGENISARNLQFCELTALYWVWKHAEEEIVGLEHYRRRFLLPTGWEKIMREERADVVLPVPLYVFPGLAGNYLFRHDARPWEVMMDVLRERSPEQAHAARLFFADTGCYSPCNMLIARKTVLNDLCAWMFPIIFQVAGKVGELPDTYQNRYPGFLSERLMSFFFYEHDDRYRVVYADKSFLQ